MSESNEVLFVAPSPTSLEFHLAQGTKCQRFSLCLLKIDSSEIEFLRLNRARMQSTITTNSSKIQLGGQWKRDREVDQYAQAQRSKPN